MKVFYRVILCIFSIFILMSSVKAQENLVYIQTFGSGMHLKELRIAANRVIDGLAGETLMFVSNDSRPRISFNDNAEMHEIVEDLNTIAGSSNLSDESDSINAQFSMHRMITQTKENGKGSTTFHFFLEFGDHCNSQQLQGLVERLLLTNDLVVKNELVGNCKVFVHLNQIYGTCVGSFKKQFDYEYVLY